MYCRNCKKEIDDNATICPYCQTETDILFSENAQEQENTAAPEVKNDNAASDEAKIESAQNADEIADNPSSENAYYSPSAQADDTVSQNIQPAYNFVDDKNESASNSANDDKKKKIIFAVIAVAVIALFFVFKDSILPFSGTYEDINNGTVFSFNGDTYVQTTDDTTYTGTFTKSGKRITLMKDEDTGNLNFVKKGNLLYREDDFVSAEVFDTSSGYVNQDLTFNFSMSLDSSEGSYGSLTVIYSLESDGTYERYGTIGINGKGGTVHSGSGTYSIQNDFLVFCDDDGGEPLRYLIVDGHVYMFVYEKK